MDLNETVTVVQTALPLSQQEPDKVALKGTVAFVLRDEQGKIKEERTQDNLIVTVGKDYLAGGILNAIATPFVAIAIGTGNTAAALADTALQTEVARGAFDSSSVPANVATMVKNFAAGIGTGAITEAGIFSNTIAGGNMLSRIVFAVINKAASDSLQITWTVTLA